MTGKETVAKPTLFLSTLKATQLTKVLKNIYKYKHLGKIHYKDMYESGNLSNILY